MGYLLPFVAPAAPRPPTRSIHAPASQNLEKHTHTLFMFEQQQWFRCSVVTLMCIPLAQNRHECSSHVNVSVFWTLFHELWFWKSSKLPKTFKRLSLVAELHCNQQICLMFNRDSNLWGTLFAAPAAPGLQPATFSPQPPRTLQNSL